MTSRSRSNAGFTLVEVVIVLVMLLFIAGIVAPAFSNVIPSVRLAKAGDELLATVNKARSEAALTGRTHRLYFIKTGTVEVPLGYYLAYEPDPLGQPATYWKLPNWTAELPEGVTFESTEGTVVDPDTDLDYIEFSSDGTATQATFILVRESGEKLVVEVNPSNGMGRINPTPTVAP